MQTPKQTAVQSLANPTRFMALSGVLLPWLSALAVLTVGAGVVWGLWLAPTDYQHGHTVRIMYIHVPSAWIAMGAYTLTAISSIGLLVWRHPLADVSARAAVPIGAAFTLICLVTGALWGKPGWGAYWVWDARLTSVLILFFLYLGLIALRSSIEDEALAAKLTAVLAIVGVVLLPIIKFSVDWWWTMHQPASVLRMSGSTIHWSLRAPLFVMAAGLMLAFIALHMKAMRNEILRRRVKALLAQRVASAMRQGQGPAAAVAE